MQDFFQTYSEIFQDRKIVRSKIDIIEFELMSSGIDIFYDYQGLAGHLALNDVESAMVLTEEAWNYNGQLRIKCQDIDGNDRRMDWQDFVEGYAFTKTEAREIIVDYIIAKRAS